LARFARNDNLMGGNMSEPKHRPPKMQKKRKAEARRGEWE
jgi:hypothetical protein